MKVIMHNVCTSLFMFCTLFLPSKKILALTSDNQKPIHINSERQAVDMTNNTVTLTGNVIIHRGSINIHADKVIITRYDGKHKNEIVESFGNPVTFYQLQDDGKPVRGHAQNIRYETYHDLVILTGNACLERLDSKVHSDRIIYLLKKKQMQAFSDKGKRVTTILMPVQIQN